MQKKVDSLANPSPLSKSVDVLRQSCLLVACKRLWPLFPMTPVVESTSGVNTPLSITDPLAIFTVFGLLMSPVG